MEKKVHVQYCPSLQSAYTYATYLTFAQVVKNWTYFGLFQPRIQIFSLPFAEMIPIFLFSRRLKYLFDLTDWRRNFPKQQTFIYLTP